MAKLQAAVGCSLLAAALFAPDGVRAQTQAENIAAARALGIQGIQLADQGDCPAAIEKLERAIALYYAPTMLGRLGECQVQIGQIVLGTENLNRVVREQLAPNAPQAFRDAQQRAQRVLEKALPRIAHLVLTVAPGDAQATVTVSGVPVPAALLGAERPTDPGTHEVLATAPGYLPAKTRVTLPEGSRQEISIVLSPDPTAAPRSATPRDSGVPSPAGVMPPSSTSATASTTGRSNALAYVLLGVGGAGIVTGSVVGVLALSKKNDLECPNDRCPPSEHDDYDTANSLALVSTIGFGVGIAGAAAGTILLLTGGKEEPAVQVGSVRARPFLTPNGIGASGTF